MHIRLLNRADFAAAAGTDGLAYSVEAFNITGNGIVGGSESANTDGCPSSVGVNSATLTSDLANSDGPVGTTNTTFKNTHIYAANTQTEPLVAVAGAQ